MFEISGYHSHGHGSPCSALNLNAMVIVQLEFENFQLKYFQTTEASSGI